MGKGNKRECKVCFNKRVLKTLLPCNHKLCGTCKMAVEDCPFCRETITNSLKTCPYFLEFVTEREIYIFTHLFSFLKIQEQEFVDLVFNKIDENFIKQYFGYWYSLHGETKCPTNKDYKEWMKNNFVKTMSDYIFSDEFKQLIARKDTEEMKNYKKIVFETIVKKRVTNTLP